MSKQAANGSINNTEWVDWLIADRKSWVGRDAQSFNLWNYDQWNYNQQLQK